MAGCFVSENATACREETNEKCDFALTIGCIDAEKDWGIDEQSR